MSVMISGYASNNDKLSHGAVAAIDKVSISLSEGNWREHLSEVFLGEAYDLNMPAQKMSDASAWFVDHMEGRTNLSDHTKWHIDMAKKIQNLCNVSRDNGADMVGIIS